jgi:hypothetical protein
MPDTSVATVDEQKMRQKFEERQEKQSKKRCAGKLSEQDFYAIELEHVVFDFFGIKVDALWCLLRPH